MTRLELAKLQLSLVPVQPRHNGAWRHYMGIVTREKNRMIELASYEAAAEGLRPFWAQGEALEVRGPRNEDPISCQCKGCVSGALPYDSYSWWASGGQFSKH